ncbi:MAG: hypothetical protein AAGJ70_00830, partial [Pseudomonadota bacterium]
PTFDTAPLRNNDNTTDRDASRFDPLESEAQTQPARLTWRVTNPFRLFTDPAITDLHRDAFNALSADEKATPVIAVERRLAQAFRRGWAAKAVGKTCWRPRAHRYGGCRRDNPYIRPRHHRVTVTLEDPPEPDAMCNWSFRGKGARRGEKDWKRCGEPVEFKAPYPGGGTARVTLPNGDRKSIRIAVTDTFVVGIGDSFGSGDGNPDVPAKFSDARDWSYGEAPGERALFGYPTRAGSWATFADTDFLRNGPRWLGRACRRSLYSYQTRVALQLAIEDPHRAVTFAHFACGGAEIPQGMFVKYKGNEWVPSPPRVPQISAVAEAQCGETRTPQTNYPDAYTIQGKLPVLRDMVLKKCPRKRARGIDLLLVSIGGNDIGFAKLVANAVLANQSALARLSGWAGGVYGPEDARPLIEELPVRYKALNRALHGLLHVPWKQSDRIILTGYPPMAVVDDAGRVCPDGRAGMSVFPDYSMNAKRVRDGEKVAEQLNTVMRRAARRYNWSFVDAHRRKFIGRGLCADGNPVLDSASFDEVSPDDVRMPRLVDGRWQPYPPSAYRAYASRQRWFRTPNDAYLTGHYHTRRTIARRILSASKLQWFQLILASSYSGAFHPTAEGHAAMADAVMPTARRVLDKYRR